MGNKYIVAGSVILTLILLGGMAAIINYSSQTRNNAANSALLSQASTREAAYQDLIAKANQEIQSLNEKVVALQEGKDLISGQKTISAKEAVELARQEVAAEDYLLNIPELAQYQDRTVFEVRFTSGTVYVDAFNGEIAYSDIPVKISPEQAIQIAGQYLNIDDLSRASVQTIQLDGGEFYKVSINNYILYIDAYGSINKVQIVQYAPQQSSSGSSNSERDDDDHEEDEHEAEDD